MMDTLKLQILGVQGNGLQGNQMVIMIVGHLDIWHLRYSKGSLMGLQLTILHSESLLWSAVWARALNLIRVKTEKF